MQSNSFELIRWKIKHFELFFGFGMSRVAVRIWVFSSGFDSYSLHFFIFFNRLKIWGKRRQNLEFCFFILKVFRNHYFFFNCVEILNQN